MPLTKQQKILGVVVALGASAVGLDRFVLGSASSGPASASASASLNQAITAPATVEAVAPAAEAPRPAAREMVTGHPELSDRLQTLAATQALEVDSMIDAFAPRGQWAEAKPEEIAKPQAKPFDQRHQLEAVMASASGAVAIVDGRTLRPGNLYDGHVLRGVSDTSVTFEREGTLVKLYLPGAGPAR